VQDAPSEEYKTNDLKMALSSAQILIQLIKFSARGYVVTEATLDLTRTEFCPLFSTMNTASRMRYIKAQILNKLPAEQRVIGYKIFVKKMEELGFQKEYERYIKPFENLLNLKQ